METDISKLSWIHPDIEISKSKIDGVGLHVKKDMPEGEILIVQVGRILHVSKVDLLPKQDYSYRGFQIEREFYMLPLVIAGRPLFDGIFTINHSCNPNTGFSGQVTLVSMCDIKAGSEITYDYAMTDMEQLDETPWEKIDCHCGEILCRKKISGSDWKLPELQEKYSGYFSLYVTKCIAEEKQNS